MDGKEATISDAKDSDIVGSEITFWKMLVTDEVPKARIAVGLVHALADNTIRDKYSAIRQSIAREWEMLSHTNVNVDSGLIEDDSIASVGSLELIQLLAEADYLGVELIAVLSNRLTILMAMYQDSEQRLSAEIEQYFAQMASFLNSARRRISEHATQSEKQETNHRLYAWSYPDLQHLQNVLLFCGIPEALPLPYSHMYGCMLENPKLYNKLQELVRHGTTTWELALAEYDTVFYRLLTRIEVQRNTADVAKKRMIRMP